MNVPVKLSLIGLFLGGLFFSSCTKDDDDDIYNALPVVPVDLYLNLNEPSNYDITYPGGWIYALGGSRGIIIYRLQDEFIAYERHTPYNSDQSCAVVSVDSTNLYAVDACSKSRFILVDGSVIDGPAAIPLKRYQTSLQADVLRVFN